MLTLLLIALVLSIYGAFFLVVAYHEPPPSLAWLFKVRVPLFVGLLLLFVPEPHTVKVGRTGIGTLLILSSIALGIRTFYHLVLGWS